MGMYDVLPPLNAKCPFCHKIAKHAPQTKNLDRLLDAFDIDHIFANIQHRIFGITLCSDCDKFFYVEAVFDEKKKIKKYKPQKKNIWSSLYYLTRDGF